MKGALGDADQRPAPRAPGQNQRPAPPNAPGLAWASRSPGQWGHPPDLFSPGLNRGLQWAGMLENLDPAPRAALLLYRVPPFAHTRAAQVRKRRLRRHAMVHATTSGGIMNDAVLVCIRKTSALRRHAMLHTTHYPTRISSAYRHKP